MGPIFFSLICLVSNVVIGTKLVLNKYFWNGEWLIIEITYIFMLFTYKVHSKYFLHLNILPKATQLACIGDRIWPTFFFYCVRMFCPKESYSGRKLEISLCATQNAYFCVSASASLRHILIPSYYFYYLLFYLPRK
jgi:hypothetical protein